MERMILSIMNDHGSGTLSGDIRRLLAVNGRRDMSLGDIVSAVGDRGFGILFVLLSLPSALPVPAPGYSTPFGIVLFLLSLQLLAGRSVPWIPEWASRKIIRRSTADKMISGTASFFSFVERFIRPRMPMLLGRTATKGYCFLLLLMSGLMILPIPLTNTLPAMVIFCVGVAMTERDGLALLAALFFGIAAVLLYTVAFWLITTYGVQGMREAKEIIKGWLF